MKRINREITIFNLSMLDVMTGAFGAVMLVLLILMTQKFGEEAMSCQDIKEELMTTSEQLVKTTDELAKTRKELQQRTIEVPEAAKEVSVIAKVLDSTADKFKWTITKISQMKKELFESSRGQDDAMAFNIPKKIVMMIDLSGSMAANGNKYNEDRLSQIKAALKMFIAGMDSNYSIDIVYYPAFSENINKSIAPDFKILPEPAEKCRGYESRDEAYDNTALTCYKYGYFEGKLLKIESDDIKYRFYKKIACLQAYHDTPTLEVLDFVLSGSRYKDAEGIILFSDGQPDALRKKQLTKNQLLGMIKKKNATNKKIFTIGVGTEFRNQEDTASVGFLKELASQNSGFYIGF